MKLKEVTVSVAMKATKNFSTVDGGVILTATVDEGEKAQDVHENLSGMAWEMLGKDMGVGSKVLPEVVRSMK